MTIAALFCHIPKVIQVRFRMLVGSRNPAIESCALRHLSSFSLIVRSLSMARRMSWATGAPGLAESFSNDFSAL